ncbi:MAG: histidinol-phosphate transaminase [Thermodesulfobacteriota bacterium]|nr:histidinol-phosphate transaminase [Thermodesulfobacteriota bacterium]
MKELVKKFIKELTPYPPGKPIEELEREYGITGSIKLASNENPLGPSPKAARAIKESINKINRYPDSSGYYLKNSLAKKFGFPMANIILGNGSDEIIKLIAHAFLSTDDEVIIPFPTFLMYEKNTQSFQGKIIRIPLTNFFVDLPSILRAVSDKTKIIFLNNPNNPTGTALTIKEISHFLQSTPKEVIVVLDEAYIEFATDKNIESGICLLKSNPNLVILRTFSKLYGLAGLRIGYGFSSEDLINGLNLVQQPFSTNYMAQIGAVAALNDNVFVKKTLALTVEGLKFLYSQLNRMGLDYITTQTNFFMIKTPIGAKDTYKRMLKEGVIIRSMEDFGMKDFIRISVGLPEENERFIKTLKKILY